MKLINTKLIIHIQSPHIQDDIFNNHNLKSGSYTSTLFQINFYETRHSPKAPFI